MGLGQSACMQRYLCIRLLATCRTRLPTERWPLITICLGGETGDLECPNRWRITITDLDSEHYRKLERMYLSAPINDFFQPTIKIERGRAVITNPVRRELFHAAGAAHGSVYFKVLDDSAWFAVNSLVTDVFVLTTAFTTYLTRPVTSGILTAIGEVVNEGRTQWLAEAVVYDEEDREVGRGSGTFVKSRSLLTPEIGYA